MSGPRLQRASGLLERIWLAGIIVTLTWGAGAFGSNYPWAYTPLLVACAALGLAGLWLGRRAHAPSRFLVLCLLWIALGVVAQMVPLPTSRLGALSPGAVRILGEYNVPFALGVQPSHPLSIDPSRTRLGLAFVGGFALLLVGIARTLTREIANRLCDWLATLGAALAVVGIVQGATFNGKIYGFWELKQGGSPFGPFVNRNHFAGWMLMALPVALGYFLALLSRGMRGRQPGLRNLVLWFSTEHANRAVLTGSAILVMALSLVLTMSRSGMLGLAVALVIVGLVIVRHQPGTWQRAFGFGYLVLLVIAVASWVGLDQIVGRFAQVKVADINERPAIWADTIRIAGDFWLTGTGLNTYGVSTLFYQTSVPGAHLREAHSDYLQLAAEGGLLLGIPIVLAILAFGWEVRRRLREDVGSIWWIRMGAVTGLLAIAFQSAGDFSLQMPGNAALFAVLAGLALHNAPPSETLDRSLSARHTAHVG